MRIVKTIIVVCSLALTAGAETPQEMTTRLVSRYQKQISMAKGVTYQFTHEGTGSLARVFPPTIGEVRVVPSRGGGLFDRARISAVSGAGDQAQKIEVVADGELVRSLDVKDKRVISAPVWRNGVELVNLQYLTPLALVSELAGLGPADIRYKGEKTVGTTECVIVEADAPMASLTLLLGKNDALLYGGVARKPEAWGDGTITMTFDAMSASATIPDDSFVMETPTGYAEIQYSGSFPTLGAAAPNFRLAGFDGRPVTLETFEGRVVVLDFWATWCAPCKKAMPGLQRLHDRYASRGLTIIGVNHDEKGDAHAYLAHHKYSYTFASSEGSDVAEHYKPNLPMVVVIDRQGRMVEVFSGYFGEESDRRLEALVKSLL